MPELQVTFLDVQPHVLLKLAVAVLCGLLLGFERESKDKPAGLRTIVLITVGATLYMAVGELITLSTGPPGAPARADPSRVAAQVVTGIGFLGAGTIIRARGAIYGLTTAAIIWVAAAIGLLVGIGFFTTAIAVTLLVLATLGLMDPLRRTIGRHAEIRRITLLVPDDVLTLQRVRHILLQNETGAEEVTVERLAAGTLRVQAFIRAGRESSAGILEAIADVPGVRGVPYSEEQGRREDE